MTANRRRAISWAVGIVGGLAIYLLFLNAPQEMGADGTLESRGTGNALTLLVTIGAVYLFTLFLLEWKNRPAATQTEKDDT